MKTKLLIGLFITLFALTGKAQTINNCSTCSTKLLTEAQLKEKSLEELALLRNEIYARKGYVFKNGMYQSYFETKDWYKSAASNNDIKFSDIENQNFNLLKSLEENIKKKREVAIQDVKKLKNALNTNDEAVINSFLGKMKFDDAETYKGVLADLKITLNYINLDNIRWNKGRGLYSVQIDNGYNISEYRIYIEDNTVTIKCGDNSHSEIFGDFDDGYSDYHSETEYQYWWIFDMKESGIVFQKFDAAG